MKAKTESISVAPVNDEYFLADYLSDEPDCCCELLIMSIGVVGEIGTDDFRLYVCTPRWLERAITLHGTYGR